MKMSGQTRPPVMGRRWVVFTVQAAALAVIWGLFLTVVAKHPWDGWFAIDVVGVALIVPLVYLWRSSRADTRQA
jgi:hypothetical protein